MAGACVKVGVPIYFRKSLPPVHALNGAIYLCKRDVFQNARTFEPTGTIGYVMPPERSLDVDTPFDLRVCEVALRDIGVGAGRTTHHLQPVAKRYEAVDYSPVMVRFMQRLMLCSGGCHAAA